MKKKKRRDFQKGVAITEFVLTLPLLLVLCAGVVDMGMVLTQYVRLSEATHTGLRLAVSYTTLEPGTFTSSLCSYCSACSPASQSALHSSILNRVEELLRLNKVKVDFTTLCLSSEVAPSVTEPARNTVTLKIKANYSAMFPGISQIPIEVSAKGPLLN